MLGSTSTFTLVAALLSASSLISAQQQQCSRVTVRKEMHDLTPDEWNTYVSTIRQAATTPGNTPGQTMWEEFAAFHMQLSDEAHGNCQFLPWHRMYMAWAERRLQTLNPNFAFFYWDSARDWNRAGQAPIFNYLGRADGVVRDGPLAGITFSATTQNQLIRDFRFPNIGNLPSVEAFSQTYQQSLARGGYGWYVQQIEAYHGIFHTQIGGSIGQMNSMYSPLDPLFWSHHGHMDWLWFTAQNGWRDAGRDASFQMGGQLFNGGQCTLQTRLSGFVQGQTIADVMDPSNLCVRYALPGEPTNGTGPVPPVSSSSAVVPIPSATSLSSAVPVPSVPVSSVPVPTVPVPSVPVPSVPVPTVPVPTSVPTNVNPQPRPTNPSWTPRTPQQAIFQRFYHRYISVRGRRTRRLQGDASNQTVSELEATHPTARLLLPSDYSPVNACPNKLPDSWIQMTYKRNLTVGQTVREEILSRCYQTVQLLQSGNNITMFPVFLDTPDRPVILGNHTWGSRAVTPQALHELSSVTTTTTATYASSTTATNDTPTSTSSAIVSSTVSGISVAYSTAPANPYNASTVKPMLSAAVPTTSFMTLTSLFSIILGLGTTLIL